MLASIEAGGRTLMGPWLSEVRNIASYLPTKSYKTYAGKVITSVITFGVTGYGIFLHHRGNPFAGGSKLATLARILAEIITALLWVATATLMLRHKAGCEQRDLLGYCRTNIKWVDRPLVTWTVAIAFSFIQMFVVLALDFESFWD